MSETAAASFFVSDSMRLSAAQVEAFGDRREAIRAALTTPAKQPAKPRKKPEETRGTVARTGK